jgi:Fe-S-cluster-containing dehydrogenase component
MHRRDFLKTTLVAGTAALTGADLCARESRDPGEFVGILVDTTRCIGCRACELACGEEHDMLVPDVLNDGALEKHRTTSDKQWMVVNRHETEAGEVFVKRQCMHCYQAACAIACPTEAMNQTRNGPVIWDGDKCLGCRYCMTSCPFDMPKFEYGEWNPEIQKCTMCFERLEAGKTITFTRSMENMKSAEPGIFTFPPCRSTRSDSEPIWARPPIPSTRKNSDE